MCRQQKLVWIWRTFSLCKQVKVFRIAWKRRFWSVFAHKTQRNFPQHFFSFSHNLNVNPVIWTPKKKEIPKTLKTHEFLALSEGSQLFAKVPELNFVFFFWSPCPWGWCWFMAYEADQEVTMWVVHLLQCTELLMQLRQAIIPFLQPKMTADILSAKNSLNFWVGQLQCRMTKTCSWPLQIQKQFCMLWDITYLPSLLDRFAFDSVTLTLSFNSNW